MDLLPTQVLSVTQTDKAQLEISSPLISDQQNDKQVMSHGVNHLGSDQLKISTGGKAFWLSIKSQATYLHGKYGTLL